MKNEKKTDKIAEKRQLKRLFLWAVVLAIFCALLAISVLLYFFAPRDYDTYILEVPSFIGLDEGSIGECDRIEINREWIYSDEAQKGIVVSQVPYSGAKRKVKSGKACAVTVYISLGEKSERIPNLLGVDQTMAAASLRSIGARVRSVAIYGDGEDGIVLGTSPKENCEIREGDTVTLFVSRRRVASPITVPSFIGMEQSEAVKIALSLGLFIEDVERIGDGSCISAQSIPEGALVRYGSYISFKTGEVGMTERDWPPVPE